MVALVIGAVEDIVEVEEVVAEVELLQEEEVVEVDDDDGDGDEDVVLELEDDMVHDDDGDEVLDDVSLEVVVVEAFLEGEEGHDQKSNHSLHNLQRIGLLSLHDLHLCFEFSPMMVGKGLLTIQISSGDKIN